MIKHPRTWVEYKKHLTEPYSFTSGMPLINLELVAFETRYGRVTLRISSDVIIMEGWFAFFIINEMIRKGLGAEYVQFEEMLNNNASEFGDLKIDAIVTAVIKKEVK